MRPLSSIPSAAEVAERETDAGTRNPFERHERDGDAEYDRQVERDLIRDAHASAAVLALRAACAPFNP
jgi:hypothetical protein